MSKFVCGTMTSVTSFLHKNILQDDVVNKFFLKTIDSFLETFFVCISKNSESTIKKAMRMTESFKSHSLFANCELYIDSAGFQVSTGKIHTDKIEDLIDTYYTFLQRDSNYDYGFILDVPLTNVSKGGNDVKLNDKSYKYASNLPESIRKKIIYIHHFGSPDKFESFRKLLFELDAINKFERFSIGGLAAGEYANFPVHSIAFGLVDVLKEALRVRRSNIPIHILGLSNNIYSMLSELFRLHIKRHHDIDIQFTQDTISPVKDSMVSRSVNYIENDAMRSIDFNRKNYKLESYKRILIERIKLLENYGINIDRFVDDEGDGLGMIGRSYLLLSNILFIHEREQIYAKVCKELYSLVEDKRYDELSNLIGYYTGKKAKYNKQISNLLRNSFDLLESLDTNKQNYYSQYLSRTGLTVKEDNILKF